MAASPGATAGWRKTVAPDMKSRSAARVPPLGFETSFGSNRTWTTPSSRAEPSRFARHRRRARLSGSRNPPVITPRHHPLPIMTLTPDSLLDPDEPDPVAVHRPDGRSPYFLTCDHGGRLLPRRLGDLGIPAFELERHIGWDIGVAGLTRQMAQRLDATAIRQIYSRLVCDCNRPPDAPDFVTLISENTHIPG